MKFTHRILLDYFDPGPDVAGWYNGLVVNWDNRASNWMLKPELRDWLRLHKHQMSWKRTDDLGCEIYLNFRDQSDLLLFKLTWGGK